MDCYRTSTAVRFLVFCTMHSIGGGVKAYSFLENDIFVYELVLAKL